jgi:uncharacterized protein (DUF3084 family)
MKKLISFIIAVLFFSATYSQISYPKFDVDSLGQKVVVLTVEQAQALDNNTDLLVLFEKLNGQIGTYDSVCLKVVNQKDSVIASQEVQINNLKNKLRVKDEKIANLQAEISKQEALVITLNSKITNKDAEIALHKGEIHNVKKKAFKRGAIIGAIVGFLVKCLIK